MWNRVNERVAGSLTEVGGGSQNTLGSQLDGGSLLLVQKSMDLNLILRLLPSGPDWLAIAVVACRLAIKASLERKKEL